MGANIQNSFFAQWNMATLPTPNSSKVSDDEEEGNHEVVPLHQSPALLVDQ
jgi:hypothetical protein